MWLDGLLLFMGSFRDLPGTLLKVGHKYLSPRCKPMRAAPAVTAAAGGLLRGSTPAPRMWGSYPHAPAFALYSTYFLIHRHCLRPRIVRRVVRHDPRPVHPGGPVNAASFRRAIGAVKTAAAPPAGLCKPLSVLGSALGVPGILLQHSRTP